MRSLGLVALVGCSFATTGAPSRRERDAPIECTTSNALPLLDTAATVVLGVIGVQMALAKDSCPESGSCEDPHAAGIRRGGFLFIGWKAPRHVHVYRDGRLIVKWSLEDWVPMKGRANARILRILRELEREGRL